MRILTVGNMYPPHHLGGYELVWRSAVEHLRARGHEVRVLTSDHRSRSPDGEEGPEVFRELGWYWRDHRFPPKSPLARLRLERRNGAILDRHLADVRPDVVSWWAMGGMSLSLIERARRRGVAANAVVCDDWLLYGPQVDGWLGPLAARPRLRRLAERGAGVPATLDPASLGPVLFLSENLRRRASARWPFSRTAVCNRGVDRALFPPSPAREWRWRLLYAGRIDPRKGIDTAIAALAELPSEARLRVDGPGDERHLAELRRQADRWGVAGRVTFQRSPRDRLAEVYADADAVVFPVRWSEPWGLVPLEAMAVGTPVVASGLGGSREYLREGENCLVFEPATDPAALAESLRRLSGDAKLRRRLREGGRSTAEALGAERFNEEVERLCERAAGYRVQ